MATVTLVTDPAPVAFGGMAGKEFVTREFTVVLAGEGADVVDMPASSFKLTKIMGASNLVKSDNAAVAIGIPSYNGGALLLSTLATAVPIDITGTYRGVVWGPSV